MNLREYFFEIQECKKIKKNIHAIYEIFTTFESQYRFAICYFTCR